MKHVDRQELQAIHRVVNGWKRLTSWTKGWTDSEGGVPARSIWVNAVTRIPAPRRCCCFCWCCWCQGCYANSANSPQTAVRHMLLTVPGKLLSKTKFLSLFLQLVWTKVGLVSMDRGLWRGRSKGRLADNWLLQLQQGLCSESSFLLKVRSRAFSQSLSCLTYVQQFVLPIQ